MGCHFVGQFSDIWRDCRKSTQPGGPRGGQIPAITLDVADNPISSRQAISVGDLVDAVGCPHCVQSVLSKTGCLVLCASGKCDVGLQQIATRRLAPPVRLYSATPK